MVWLLGHRQPKGAVNGDARPTATAPHLDSTVRRRPGLRRQRRQHLSELTFRPQRQQGAASPTFLAKRSLALDGHKPPFTRAPQSGQPERLRDIKTRQSLAGSLWVFLAALSEPTALQWA